MYHRPSSIDECIKMCDQHSKSEFPKGHRETLRLATREMLGKFMEKGLRPLYDANTIVSFLTNTITPSLIELLCDETKIEELVAESLKDRTAFKERAKKYEGIMLRLHSACEDSKAREASCTREFIEMRNAMIVFSTDAAILNGLKLVYVSHETARSILDLMIDRLLIALKDHNDIMSSTDIPFSAMALGM